MSSTSPMNPTKFDVLQGYKECAGKCCKNRGIYYLKIVFLNQFGWFCEDCKNSLIKDRLVIEEHQEEMKEIDCVSFPQPAQSTITEGINK